LLASVLKGERPESALDSYEQRRRPAAAQVLELAGMMTKVATVRGAARRAFRNAVISLIHGLPPVRRRLLMGLSGLGRKALAALPEEA